MLGSGIGESCEVAPSGGGASQQGGIGGAAESWLEDIDWLTDIWHSCTRDGNMYGAQRATSIIARLYRLSGQAGGDPPPRQGPLPPEWSSWSSEGWGWDATHWSSSWSWG